MKKLTTILLAVAMTLPLVACGGGNAGNTNGGNTNSGSTDKHTHVDGAHLHEDRADRGQALLRVRRGSGGTGNRSRSGPHDRKRYLRKMRTVIR